MGLEEGGRKVGVKAGGEEETVGEAAAGRPDAGSGVEWRARPPQVASIKKITERGERAAESRTAWSSAAPAADYRASGEPAARRAARCPTPV